MCRGFDPLFSLWQDRARSFWGVFSHPPTQKRSFGYKSSQNSIFLAPKYHFSLDLFGSNFQWPAAHPQQFSDRVPPPGISGVWPCDNCRHVAKDVSSLNDKFDKLLDIVESLSKSVEENNKDKTFLQMQYTKLKDEHCVLKQQNEKLTTEVGELKRRYTNYAAPDKSGKTLLLGSSIVRNFDQNKLKDTDVICLRGAKVRDLHNELREIKDSGKEYQRVILLGGGNDASQNSQDINLDNVTSHYKSMVETAKSICSDINVVAIPPRFEPPHATGNIAALNANLVTLAQQCGVNYIENPNSFFLSNGDINDGYYYDKVHLTIKGSNKLAHSLGLVSRRSDSEDMCSINASQSSPKSWSHGDSSNSHGFIRQSNRRRGRKGPGRPQTAHIADSRTETRHVSAGVVDRGGWSQ